MSFSGDLKTFTLPDLLQRLSLSRKTGLLWIKGSDYQVSLRIHRGELTGVTTSQPARRIGQFLISRGYIEEVSLRMALNHQEGRGEVRLLGDILCTEGYMGREKLDRALQERSEEIVYDLFLLDEGEFGFEEGAPPGAVAVEVSLSLDSLVLEGIRRKEEWSRIRHVLPCDDVRVRFLRPKSAARSDRSNLWHRLRALPHRDASIGELIMTTRRSPFDIYQLLFRMLQDGELELIHTPAAAVVEASAVENLSDIEAEVLQLVRGHDFQRAWQRWREVGREAVDGEWVNRLGRQIETEERDCLRDRFPEQSVPVLALPPRLIKREDLSPKEGFLISRLGEKMTIKTLCQVMPLAEIDIFRILLGLEKRGVIRMSDGRNSHG